MFLLLYNYLINDIFYSSFYILYVYIYVCILTINSLQIIMIEGIYIVRGNIMSCTKDLTMEEMFEWCVCLRIYIPGDQKLINFVEQLKLERIKIFRSNIKKYLAGDYHQIFTNINRIETALEQKKCIEHHLLPLLLSQQKKKKLRVKPTTT